MFGDEAEREQFFEAAMAQAEHEFAADSQNSMALIRWGGALLELAHFKQGKESTDMIELAITKLKQALQLDADRADAEWCLGNAYMSLGFLRPEKPKALEDFARAGQAFKHCHQLDASNETYRKALDMIEKAPEYYDEIQAHIKAQQMTLGGDGAGPDKKASSNDFWWDVGGWALLAVAVSVTLVFLQKSSPAGAPRP